MGGYDIIKLLPNVAITAYTLYNENVVGPLRERGCEIIYTSALVIDK